MKRPIKAFTDTSGAAKVPKSINDATDTSETESVPHPLDDFDTYNWVPDVSLSDDQNFMDLVLLVTRSSQLRQGGMACIVAFVEDPDCDDLSTPSLLLQSLRRRIVTVATNQSLFKATDSDLHAEIAALSNCARSPNLSTSGCAAYITMPPCKRCFAALVAAGIQKIVSRHSPPSIITETAMAENVDIVVLKDTHIQRDRLEAFVSAAKNK